LYPHAKIGAATFAGHFLSSYRQERKAEFEFDWKKKHTLKAPIETKLEACKLLKASEYSINYITKNCQSMGYLSLKFPLKRNTDR